MGRAPLVCPVLLPVQVSVVQFSNDTRVEVPLGPLDKPAFDAAISTMVRVGQQGAPHAGWQPGSGALLSDSTVNVLHWTSPAHSTAPQAGVCNGTLAAEPLHNSLGHMHGSTTCGVTTPCHTWWQHHAAAC